MISDLQVATADDGKRLVLYPLEITLWDFYAAAALTGILTGKVQISDGVTIAPILSVAASMADQMLQLRAESAK